MKKVTDIDELILSLILLTCLNAITCLCVKTPFQLQCINIQCNVSKKINNSQVRFLGTRRIGWIREDPGDEVVIHEGA